MLPPTDLQSAVMARATADDARFRTCAFWGSNRAHFGYSPPLVRTPFWVCRAHRPNAEACAASGTTPPPLNTPGD